MFICVHPRKSAAKFGHGYTRASHTDKSNIYYSLHPLRLPANLCGGVKVNYHHQRWWLDVLYLEGTLVSMLLVIPQTYLFRNFLFFFLPSHILPDLILIEAYGAHTIAP